MSLLLQKPEDSPSDCLPNRAFERQWSTRSHTQNIGGPQTGADTVDMWDRNSHSMQRGPLLLRYPPARSEELQLAMLGILIQRRWHLGQYIPAWPTGVLWILRGDTAEGVGPHACYDYFDPTCLSTMSMPVCEPSILCVCERVDQSCSKVVLGRRSEGESAASCRRGKNLGECEGRG